MKLYAVIDTNVLVSALLRWDSVPGAIMEHALVGNIIPVLSDEIIAEYNEVLRSFPKRSGALLKSSAPCRRTYARLLKFCWV